MKKKFPKCFRLLKSHQFQRVLRLGNTFTGKYVIAHIFLGSSSHPKLGMTVSKKFGSSVQRSRFKRLVREAFRSSLDVLPSSIEIHIRPQRGALLVKMQEIRQELLLSLNHV